MNGTDPLALARRLRALREEHLTGRKITQPELAQALGVSVPLISSYESLTHPRVPPSSRVDAYAIVFATHRAFETNPPTQITDRDLNDDEQRAMNEIRTELRRLRGEAMRAGAPSDSEHSAPAAHVIADPWYFEDGGPVTIVCAQLPPDMLDTIPYTKVDDPDYIELLTYSELDSLLELFGHIRAVNPSSHVRRRIASKLDSESYQDQHLAVLGGVDWNGLTEEITEALGLPVRQVADWKTPDAQYFEVTVGDEVKQFRPVFRKVGDKAILSEDVALFAKGVNPWNNEKMVTLCYGMYGRGTYGAIRALTAYRFRERNLRYVESRFSDCEAYCILTRVPIVQGETMTPDWTSGHKIFEWSKQRG